MKRCCPEMCTFGVLGLSCEAPAAQSRPPRLARLTYRWGSVRGTGPSSKLKRVQDWFYSWIHDLVFSAGKGVSSVDAWYSTIVDIEDVRGSDSVKQSPPGPRGSTQVLG